MPARFPRAWSPRLSAPVPAAGTAARVPPIPGAATHVIDLARVTKRFDGKRQVTALDDITLAIPRGEMVSVVGPSGSGKSTLLNLIGGLDRPTSGEVRIDGEALAGLSDDALTRVRRDKIGFIFQFFNLLPTLSSLVRVSRFPVGSSARSTGGYTDRARAMATRCRSPPDSSSGRWDRR